MRGFPFALIFDLSAIILGYGKRGGRWATSDIEEGACQEFSNSPYWRPPGWWEELLESLRTLLGANVRVSGLLSSVPPYGADVLYGERRTRPPGGHLLGLPYGVFLQTPL